MKPLTKGNIMKIQTRIKLANLTQALIIPATGIAGVVAAKLAYKETKDVAAAVGTGMLFAGSTAALMSTAALAQWESIQDDPSVTLV